VWESAKLSAMTDAAAALRGFVFDRTASPWDPPCQERCRGSPCLIRFLGVTGRCPPRYGRCNPGFASWQLSSVPRFLVPEDVERVIGSCADSMFALRDRAVLLLLARLGLRASGGVDARPTTQGAASG
jgi:integrase/recombinase XerD